MEKGARRFAFLSRSGVDSKQAAILVDDLKATGAAVEVIRGDVSVESDVQRAVKMISTNHPIRGVVQAAMVLKVCQAHFFHELKPSVFDSFPRMVYSKTCLTVTGSHPYLPKSKGHLISTQLCSTRNWIFSLPPVLLPASLVHPDKAIMRPQIPSSTRSAGIAISNLSRPPH